jgi:hypothetical protein
MSRYLRLVEPLAQVRDVARALGTTSRQLLPVAAVLGMRVSCPSSILTVDQAERLEDAWLRRARPADAAPTNNSGVPAQVTRSSALDDSQTNQSA